MSTAVATQQQQIGMSAPAATPPMVRLSSAEKLGGSISAGSKQPATSAVGGGGVLIGSKPTLLTVPPMRFLIMDAPRQANLHLYIKECRRHSVTDIVRVCEPTYIAGELHSAGIRLHEMAYPDGHSPPQDVLDRWLTLVDEVFYGQKSGGAGGGRGDRGGGGGGGKMAASSGEQGGSDSTAASSSAPHPPSSGSDLGLGSAAAAAGNGTSATPTIAVHCVAGLGRAPVLVAIALVEFANMDPVEAVTLIRRHRRGAINEKQLNYLERYRRSYRRSGAEGGCCVIS